MNKNNQEEDIYRQGRHRYLETYGIKQGCFGFLLWTLGILSILFAAKCIIDFFNS